MGPEIGGPPGLLQFLCRLAGAAVSHGRSLFPTAGIPWNQRRASSTGAESAGMGVQEGAAGARWTRDCGAFCGGAARLGPTGEILGGGSLGGGDRFLPGETGVAMPDHG